MTTIELLQLATQIKNETNSEANTAERLGLMLIELIDAVDDKSDKSITDSLALLLTALQENVSNISIPEPQIINVPTIDSNDEVNVDIESKNAIVNITAFDNNAKIRVVDNTGSATKAGDKIIFFISPFVGSGDILYQNFQIEFVDYGDVLPLFDHDLAQKNGIKLKVNEQTQDGGFITKYDFQNQLQGSNTQDYSPFVLHYEYNGTAWVISGFWSSRDNFGLPSVEARILALQEEVSNISTPQPQVTPSIALIYNQVVDVAITSNDAIVNLTYDGIQNPKVRLTNQIGLPPKVGDKITFFIRPFQSYYNSCQDFIIEFANYGNVLPLFDKNLISDNDAIGLQLNELTQDGLGFFNRYFFFNCYYYEVTNASVVIKLVYEYNGANWIISGSYLNDNGFGLPQYIQLIKGLQADKASKSYVQDFVYSYFTFDSGYLILPLLQDPVKKIYHIPLDTFAGISAIQFYFDYSYYAQPYYAIGDSFEIFFIATQTGTVQFFTFNYDYTHAPIAVVANNYYKLTISMVAYNGYNGTPFVWAVLQEVATPLSN
jgi:hypothetical protein